MDKQAHILQSAQILFAQFGLKNVTTDSIAREARVSKATIYKYFRNKREIFDRVVHDEIDALLSRIREAVEAEKSAEKKLWAHLRSRLGKVGEFVNFYRVTQDSWGDYWPHFAQIRNDFLTREQRTVSEILKDGIRSGELQVEDCDKAAYVLVLALASVEYQWFLNEGRFTLDETVDTMIKMVMKGIGRK